MTFPPFLRLLAGTILAVASGLTAVRAQSLPALLPEEKLPALKGLLSSALNQSPAALTASLDVARAEAQRLAERSVLWPTLTADARWAAVESSLSGGSGSSRNTGFFYNFNFNQPVYHWGALKAQAQIGELGSQIAHHRLEEVYRNLAVTIRTQYLDLIQKKKSATYTRLAFTETQRQVQALEQRLAAGMIPSAELIEPRLRITELSLAADRADEALSSACRTVGALCGVGTLDPATVPDDLPGLGLSEAELPQVLQSDLPFNPLETPQARILSANLAQTDLNYKITAARTRPKLNLTLAASQQNSTDAANGRVNQFNITQQTIGVGANWLIFDGFATRSNKASLRALKRQQEFALSELDRTTRERAAGLRKQMEFSQRSLSLAETRYSMAMSVVRAVENDLKLGISTQDALNGVQATARGWELQLLAARADFYSRLSEYLSAINADPVVKITSARSPRHGQ